MVNNICIIPARGGSKRIPGKNIKDFIGKPIIAYSIEAARESGLFDEVMVSTDDSEIAQIAKDYGARVPFLRSSKNADDFATTAEVLLEVIECYGEQGRNFDNLCCIYPCAPFVQTDKLRKAHEMLVEESLDCVFPVVPFGYPVQRALRVQGHNASMFSPQYEFSRSQDLEEAYHDCGQFYFVKVESLFRNRSLFSVNTGVIILGLMEAQDIDTESDWKLAELKYRLLHE